MPSTSAASEPASPAAYHDGVTARRRSVRVVLGAAFLDVLAEDGALLARWPYAAIRAEESVPLRLKAPSLSGLARLEAGADLAAQIARRCPRLHEGQGCGAARIVGLSLLAAASLVLSAIVLVPLAADRLAPLVPPWLERRLGEGVDNQVRLLLGRETCMAPEGRAALESLAGKLRARANLPMPVEVAVLPSGQANAFALPGGRVYLLGGLLGRAESPDELAGVLAHELGHVAGRDGLRRLIRAGGTSALLGLLFGDVAGGGTVVLLGELLVSSAHSREAESAADGFAADLMLALGRPTRPMGAFLLRLTGEQRGGSLAPLRSHPVSEDRLAALAARDRPPTGAPLLDEREWIALKGICGGGERM